MHDWLTRKRPRLDVPRDGSILTLHHTQWCRPGDPCREPQNFFETSGKFRGRDLTFRIPTCRGGYASTYVTAMGCFETDTGYYAHREPYEVLRDIKDKYNLPAGYLYKFGKSEPFYERLIAAGNHHYVLRREVLRLFINWRKTHPFNRSKAEHPASAAAPRRVKTADSCKLRTYCILDAQGHAKIGISTQPTKRLKALQTASASELTLFATLDGNHEDRLHKLFKHLHVKGEWFKAHTDILKTFQSSEAA